jgi:hypothetical protein
MFEKGVYMLLAADTGVSSYVGNGIYWTLQPKGTGVPSIVLSIVATKDLYAAAGCTGLREALIQVDAYATDYYSCRATSRAARLLLENFIGNLPDADATDVIASFIEKDWDMPYEPGAKGFIFRSLLEVRLHYYDTSLPVSTPSNPVAVIDGGTGDGDDTGVMTEASVDGGTT